MATSWLAVLTSWLTVALTAAGGPTSVTVETTSSLEAPAGTQLTLTCGRNHVGPGELRFWHTPFGDLHSAGFHGDAVVLQPDRSLLIPNSSVLHSGSYYCLLQRTAETRLQPYQLLVLRPGRDGGPQDGGPEAAGPEDAGPEDAGPEDAGPEDGGPGRQQGVSDGQFAGAVAASVLITFVLGFSIGALTRTQVLRCLTAVTMKLKSPRRRQLDIPDRGPDVAMTTLSPMSNKQEIETVSSTTSSPPRKPQRRFRRKTDEETIEGSDEKVEGSDEEVKGSDDEVEGSDEEVEGSDEEDGQTGVRDSEETEASRNQEVKHEAPAPQPSRRVIRLYNYDEDGQRYQHLPDPAPQEPSPAPRLKQRSLSLTRLNAIMAAASASPLDSDATRRFHMEI